MAFRHLGYDVHDLLRPEIHFAPVARKTIAPGSLHVTFRPPEALRLLKDARNIAYIAWSSEEIPTPKPGVVHPPFSDMRRMLALPDEIWGSCAFTCDVLRNSGFTHVHHLPVPVAIPSKAGPIDETRIPPALDAVRWSKLRIGFGRYRHINPSSNSPATLSAIMAAHYPHTKPDVFIATIDANDFRDDLSALIAGYLEFHCDCPDSLLLVNLVVDTPAGDPDAATLDILQRCLFGFEIADCDGIWLTAETFSEATRSALHHFASAYISTSTATGQNLPLLEAMGCEVVPISPCHTAMADYITMDTAVIIDTEADGRTAAVASALRAFRAMPPAKRRALGRCARAMVADNYSVERIAELIAARLQHFGD